MVPDYVRAIAIFPTFFFIVMFLILSALYYNRYRDEESDEKAYRHFRDYIIITNSQSVFLSVINGMIIIVLYSEIAVGVTLLLITQALATYVFVAQYMKSNYDALFFLVFSVLGYVFELLYMIFAGYSRVFLGRELWGLSATIIAFIIIVAILSALLVIAAAYANSQDPDRSDIKGYS